jgi:hypothetical protein
MSADFHACYFCNGKLEGVSASPFTIVIARWVLV